MTSGLQTVDRESRRALVDGRSDIDGIDFVEVLSNRSGTPGFVPGAPAARTLLVRLLNGQVPTAWTASVVDVLGGVRTDPVINPVHVVWAYPAAAVLGEELPPRVTAEDRELVSAALDQPDVAATFVVRTSSSGDRSAYLLRLHPDGGTDAAGGEGQPLPLDPPLAEAPFTFAVDCPSDLDCAVPDECPPASWGSPVLDYLARDYEGLRSRLLDRLATLLPDWTDRSPADIGVTLVELFAHLGDRLAYWQDAVAAEAYLGTARRRTSVRRHARLLDYAMHEGCSARTWLAFTTTAAFELPARAPVADTAPPDGTAADALVAGGTVFETMARAPLRPERNRLDLHAWGAPDAHLPAGTTCAFVALPAGRDPALQAGDVLVLADVPKGGDAQQGDPTRRFPVRLDRAPVPHVDLLLPGRQVLELHWHPADALPAPLRISEPDEDEQPAVRAVALANVVPADDGGSLQLEGLVPRQVPTSGEYRPLVPRTGLAWADPTPAPAGEGATRHVPDPSSAVAQLALYDDQRVWTPVRDLLGSGRLAAHFVVEADDDGSVRLRFGDGVAGRRPTAGTAPRAWLRAGGGARGNVAAGTLTVPCRLPDGTAAVPDGARISVWNPLRAVGGTDAEPVAEVRELAPHAFRQQRRAVTPAGYAVVAMADPGVQRAVARRRWTGSWYAQEVTVDPVAARADDSALVQALAEALEVRRMAGVDVELARPVYVAVDITLTGCVAAGYLRADVERQLLDVLSARLLPDGRRGFFHPDRLTFGQPVLLSDLIAAAMGVAGLVTAGVSRFERRGTGGTRAAIAAGRIDADTREVLRCDSDPSAPEAGQLVVELGGGS